MVKSNQTIVPTSKCTQRSFDPRNRQQQLAILIKAIHKPLICLFIPFQHPSKRRRYTISARPKGLGDRLSHEPAGDLRRVRALKQHRKCLFRRQTTPPLIATLRPSTTAQELGHRTGTRHFGFCHAAGCSPLYVESHTCCLVHRRRPLHRFGNT